MRKVSIKNIISGVFLTVSLLILGFWAGQNYPKGQIATTINFQRRTLDKYAIPALKQNGVASGTLKLLDQTAEEKYKTGIFDFEFAPALDTQTKISTGQFRISNSEEKSPIIVMLRGYIDQTIYETGVGSKNASAYFAENGYITLAPDFLGYGGSDGNAADIFESRFQTYTLTISLLNTIFEKKLPAEILTSWDGQNVFIWAHSNGGQIALTVLEVTSLNVPTVLWAPVSKPFPYSVLYYTDESDDEGRFIRRNLANFENRYNTNRYSLTNYLSEINSPIFILQGTSDDAIPIEWSTDLVDKLQNVGKQITIKLYAGADHDMRPEWEAAVVDSLEFFKLHTDLN